MTNKRKKGAASGGKENFSSNPGDGSSPAVDPSMKEADEDGGDSDYNEAADRVSPLPSLSITAPKDSDAATKQVRRGSEWNLPYRNYIPIV